MLIPKAAPNPRQKKVHKTSLTFRSQGWEGGDKVIKITLFQLFHLLNLIPEQHGTKLETTEEAKDVSDNRNTWNKDRDFDSF